MTKLHVRTRKIRREKPRVRVAALTAHSRRRHAHNANRKMGDRNRVAAQTSRETSDSGSPDPPRLALKRRPRRASAVIAPLVDQAQHPPALARHLRPPTRIPERSAKPDVPVRTPSTDPAEKITTETRPINIPFSRANRLAPGAHLRAGACPLPWAVLVRGAERATRGAAVRLVPALVELDVVLRERARTSGQRDRSQAGSDEGRRRRTSQPRW